jgi:hypothetical protein
VSARRLAALSLVALLGVVACKREPPPGPPPEPPPPTEPMVTVRSSEAPLLNELEDDEPPAQMARPGDLLLPGKDLAGMATTWRARYEGRPYERIPGPMSELRPSPGGAILWGFKADLGPRVEVPLTSWICAQIVRSAGDAGVDPECPRLLQRAQLADGALVAFTTCSSGPCPVALLRANVVRAITVDGISGARVVPTEGGPVLLATTRWVRAEGKHTGGALLPIALSGEAPRALAPIALDEIDARDPQRVVARLVQYELRFPTPERTVVHLTGDRRENALPDGKELSRVGLDESPVVPGR